MYACVCVCVSVFVFFFFLASCLLLQLAFELQYCDVGYQMANNNLLTECTACYWIKMNVQVKWEEKPWPNHIVTSWNFNKNVNCLLSIWFVHICVSFYSFQMMLSVCANNWTIVKLQSQTIAHNNKHQMNETKVMFCWFSVRK